MEAADIYQIAKNCRTSVEKIEKYYAAHIKTNLDAAAIYVMEPLLKKTKINRIPQVGQAFRLRKLTRKFTPEKHGAESGHPAICVVYLLG